jgi:MFS family permease
LHKSTKKILLNYVLAPLLTLLLLFLIYKQIVQKGNLKAQWDAFLQQWSTSMVPSLIVVIALAPLNWLLEAIKWKMLLRKIEPLPLSKALASTLTGIAFAIVTPNKVGDFAGRILYLKNNNRLRAAIATLISNLAQTLVTFIFGIIGLLYFMIQHPSYWVYATLFVAVVALFGLCLLYTRLDKITHWKARKPWLRKLLIALQILQRYNRKDLLQLVAVSALRFCVYNFQFLLLANVLGANIPWYTGFLVSGLMFWMITVIPSFFVADLGVRGYVAGLLFTDTNIVSNSVVILAASYFIWLLNLILPAIIGSILVLGTKVSKS